MKTSEETFRYAENEAIIRQREKKGSLKRAEISAPLGNTVRIYFAPFHFKIVGIYFDVYREKIEQRNFL